MWRAWWGWILVGGCTYVTQAEYDAQLLQRDEDLDGISVAEGDCDDTDPDVFPGQLEVPYDGIDNDCLGNGDLSDVDGDGRAALIAGGDDCDDQNAEIGPGMPDKPYDGIDADCAQDNDFDFDGDGVMALRTTEAEVRAYQAASGAIFTPVYGDCDDLDVSVFPGSPEEVPYDGIDSDCDGADDFDADGDGVPIPADCLDQARVELPLAPELAYPGAFDEPYDGVDADCALDNDFDADGDGFIRSIDLAAYQTYESIYGISLGALPGDCDDARGFVNPDGLERLGDTLDQNCDGALDRATFILGGLDVVEPLAPRIVSTDDGFVAALSATEVTGPNGTRTNSVTMLLMAPDLQARDLPSVVDTPIGPLAEPPGPALALTPTTTGVGVGHIFGSTTLTATLGSRSVSAGTLGTFAANESTLTGPPPVQASVRSVSDQLRLVTCGGTDLTVISGGSFDTVGLTSPVRTCVHDAEGQALVCTDEGCEQFPIGVGPSFEAPVPVPDAIVAARQGPVLRTELLEGVDGVRLVKTGLPPFRALAAERVQDAAAVESEGEWFVAAVTDPQYGANELRILWGPSNGPLDQAVLDAFDPARPNLEPIETAIAANADRIIVVVTLTDGVDDAFAWAVFERT
ncbi:MAG: putative metal-binding motif-containing protein [Myxococcota bacterium]